MKVVITALLAVALWTPAQAKTSRSWFHRSPRSSNTPRAVKPVRPASASCAACVKAKGRKNPNLRARSHAQKPQHPNR